MRCVDANAAWVVYLRLFFLRLPDGATLTRYCGQWSFSLMLTVACGLWSKFFGLGPLFLILSRFCHAYNALIRIQVVSEYRKARAIMADVTARDASEGTAEGLAAGATKGIWHSIFLEVDKVSNQTPC